MGAGAEVVLEKLVEEPGEFAGFFVFKALVYNDERGGVFLVRAAGIFDDDKIGAVVVDKQLPRKALPHERLAEGGAVDAGGVAAGKRALHIAGKRQVIGKFLLERGDDVGGRAVDATTGCLGQVGLNLGAGG